MILDTDSLASANALLELAASFEQEATMWREPGAKAELGRTARHLAEIARHLIRGQADVEKADAFFEAGRIVLGNVQGARRFFQVILTPPRVRSREEAAS